MDCRPIIIANATGLYKLTGQTAAGIQSVALW